MTREHPKPEHITIVIPTLNEEKAIGTVIDEIKQCGFNNILVVDGHSTDNTVKIAREKGAKVITQLGQGKAAAIKTAIQHVKTPYMLIMDADHTYDPKDIPKLLNIAPQYDQVIGLRTNRQNIPLLHRIGNQIISTTISLLTGQRIRDPCSGMYLLKTDIAKNLELTSTDFDIEAEIATQIATLGKIAETPINYRKRIGNPKLPTWKAGIQILTTAIKIAWLYNPIFLLSALASTLTIPGLTILLWQLYQRYIYGAKTWSIGWTWLGLVLTITGLQAFTTATITLLLKRMERRIIQMLK